MPSCTGNFDCGLHMNKNWGQLNTSFTAHPRLATRLPIIYPLTNKRALYGCPWASPKSKDIIMSRPLGMSSLKVVTKKPTPATPLGKPEESGLESQSEVVNPGRCQPFRSPNRPPSFRTPRIIQNGLILQYGTLTPHLIGETV